MKPKVEGGKSLITQIYYLFLFSFLLRKTFSGVIFYIVLYLEILTFCIRCLSSDQGF